MIRYRRVPARDQSLWETILTPFLLPGGAVLSLLVRAAFRIRGQRP